MRFKGREKGEREEDQGLVPYGSTRTIKTSWFLDEATARTEGFVLFNVKRLKMRRVFCQKTFHEENGLLILPLREKDAVVISR